MNFFRYFDIMYKMLRTYWDIEEVAKNNSVFTGERLEEDRYFYVLNNIKLVGAIKTSLG